jgi:UDP-N-acetylmuramoyl-tripeptide--D-alanyl-D-alanine ligase
MQQFLKQIVVGILSWEARMILKRHQPFIIAVTGSVGKTTTKDAIFHVLKDTDAVRKSEKSFNSELGVPLTVLGLPNAWSNPFRWALYLALGCWRALCSREYPKTLVLEIGADHPGDIARVTRWLKPDIALITRLPERPVHVEYFSSPDAVRREKWELVRALKPGGFLIVNGDDPYIGELKHTTDARTVTFGFGNDNMLRSDQPQVRYATGVGGVPCPVGITFHVIYEKKEYLVQVNDVLGMQFAVAALGALAVGLARGDGVEHMVGMLATLETPPGRMRIIPGKKDSVVIDDSYNASPVAGEAALETLRTMNGKRRIALLGDMLELGEFSEEEHRKLGAIAARSVDLLLTVGKRARLIAESARAAGLPKEHIHEFSSSLFAGEWMAEHVEQGDVMLVKGSQGSGENMIRMERAVKLLMAHPEDASKLLVRQEDEWQRQYK